MKNSKQSLLSYELELYKNLYEAENNHRHNYSNKVFKSITIIASFVGAVLWLIFKFLSIYQNECCYLQCINFILLVACSVIMLICVVIFFKALYDYKEECPNPIEVVDLMTEYKSQTDDEDTIIAAMNKSLIVSYRDANINNCIQNEKHIKLLRLFYKIIFVEMFLLITTFLLEILVYI